MIELLTGEEVNEKLGNYAAQKIAATYGVKAKSAVETFGPYVAVGIFDENRFLGAVIWHHYMPDYRTIEVSMAAERPGWATRSVLRELFSYPFDQLKCRKVRAIAGQKNKRACRVNVKLGFKCEGVDRLGLGNDHAVLFGLLHKECKWLKDKPWRSVRTHR